MFSPCPGFPVPMLGTWRPNAHTESQMNWLGWPGADFVAPPVDHPPEDVFSDHAPDHENEAPERPVQAPKPAREQHRM